MSHCKVYFILYHLFCLQIEIEANNDTCGDPICKAYLGYRFFGGSEQEPFLDSFLDASAQYWIQYIKDEIEKDPNKSTEWAAKCTPNNENMPLQVELWPENVQVDEIDEQKQSIQVQNSIVLTMIDPRFSKVKGCFEIEAFDYPLIWFVDLLGFFPMRYLPSYNMKFIDEEDEYKRESVTQMCKMNFSTDSAIATCKERKSFNLSGRMYFDWFPFDVQEISGYLESEFDENELATSVRQLANETVGDLVPKWSVSMKMTLDDPKKKAKHGKIGLYSTIKVEFQLSRKLTMHVLQTFIPSGMLCIASAGSVFIPWHLIPGRMGVCITTFLSLISLFNGARNQWIEASSLRAIDVWTILCYIIVFVSLMEYCIILYLTKGEKYDLNEQSSNKISPVMKLRNQDKKIRKALFLEKCSRVLFPTYTIFSFTLYFMICLLRK